jgi:hypothetical protein
MSGFQSKKMLSDSRDPALPFQEYANALFEATVAIDERNSLKPTPQQNLIWLQALSEMWVRQSRSEVSTC